MCSKSEWLELIEPVNEEQMIFISLIFNFIEQIICFPDIDIRSSIC